MAPISYRAFRRSFGAECFVSDLDHVEWRLKKGVPTPVAILELTRLEDSDNFEQVKWEVLDKFHENVRGEFVIEMGDELRVSVFAVVFEKDLKRFWVGNLTEDLDLANREDHWMQLDNSQYEEWITNLGESDDNEGR